MNTPTEKPKSTLKKAIIPTLAVILPGGALLGLAYVLAKRYQDKKRKP